MTKNVANNVVQGKVQDLTERYKRGKLEDGYYYVKIVGDKFYMLEWKDKHWYEFGWKNTEEENKKLKEENEKLKSTLKDVDYFFTYGIARWGVVDLRRSVKEVLNE